jgi:hypothetical protein
MIAIVTSLRSSGCWSAEGTPSSRFLCVSTKDNFAKNENTEHPPGGLDNFMFAGVEIALFSISTKK